MIRSTLLPLFLLLALASACLAAPADEPLVLAVHPFLAPTDIVKRFTPLAEYLTRKTGREVRIEVSRDYESHIARMGRNEVDIAFLGPASYVLLARDFPRKQLLATMEVNGSKTFKGVIAVRKDSPLKALRDLKGGSFAFGDTKSTMSYLVPVYMLHEAGVEVRDLKSYEHISNHDNVSMGVLTGRFDAGALKVDIFEKYKSQGLRALAYSPEITEHILVARQGLPTDLTEKVRAALLDILKDKDGLAAIKSINSGATNLVPAVDSDYDSLRKVIGRIEKLGVRP